MLASGAAAFALAFAVTLVLLFVVRALAIYGARIRTGLSVGVAISGNGIRLGWWLLISLTFGRVEVEGRCRWVQAIGPTFAEPLIAWILIHSS